MRQLSGLDNMFVSTESARQPMHIASIFIVDPTEAPVPITLEVVKAHLASKLHLLAPLRQRLLESPLRLGRPYWVDDPDFDLDAHVHRVGVPYPGGRADFVELVADVSRRPLDRRRPLWEWWLIEGLDDGKVACLWKVHHAYLDGVSWVALGDSFFDRRPMPVPAVSDDDWEPEEAPGSVPLLARSLVDLARVPRRLASLGIGAFSARNRARELRPRFESGELAPLPSVQPPRTPFNVPVTTDRTWAYASMSLDDFKTVKSAAGATVNDVALAVCGGAMRHYLAERGELPDRTLVANVPVSVRNDNGESAGNQITSMSVPLATDIADPLERLQAIAASTRSSKVQQRAIGADVMMGLIDVPPPVMLWLGTAFLAWSGMSARVPPMANATISNVPGSTERFYFAGGKIDAMYSTGLVSDNLAVMFGMGSYCGRMDLSITSCKAALPDPWLVADRLDVELQLLVDAVRPPARRPAARRPPARAKKAATSAPAVNKAAVTARTARRAAAKR